MSVPALLAMYCLERVVRYPASQAKSTDKRSAIPKAERVEDKLLSSRGMHISSRDVLNSPLCLRPTKPYAGAF